MRPLNADLAQSKRFILTLRLLTPTAALTVDLSLPAIPVMVDALATTLPRAQKIVGIFMIGMACGQIPAGLFSDRLGRLPTLYVGLVIFAGAGAVAAASNDINILLAARFIQGIGAAAAVVLSRAIIRDVASGRAAARLAGAEGVIHHIHGLSQPALRRAFLPPLHHTSASLILCCSALRRPISSSRRRRRCRSRRIS